MLWFNYERSTKHSWRLACSNEAISYNWALHCKKLCAALCYSQGKSLEDILVKRSHWILGRKEKNCQWRISLYLSLAFLRKLWDRHTWRKKFYIDNCSIESSNCAPFNWREMKEITSIWKYPLSSAYEFRGIEIFSFDLSFLENEVADKLGRYSKTG